MSNQPPAPPATSSAETPMATSPPKYVPQFSAATEMILKRIQSGAGSSNLSSIGGGIGANTPGYEDMRRSVLMGMKTSMNMEIPSTPVGNGNRRGSGATSKSATSTGGKGRAPSSSTPGASSAPGSATGKGKKIAKPRTKAGAKRKRAQEEEESESTDEESDVMSKLGDDDSESDISEDMTILPKITQSGRQINKPAQFVPSAYEAPPKKRQQSKRSQDQALCKRCARGHSPQNNMIVFCDGCNLGWHQLCHDPNISEETVKDESAPWFCADCSRKRGVKTAGVSWQGRNADDKRSYFNSLPHEQLVSLLMQATILHPNIPIFPPTPAPTPQLAPVSAPAKSSSRPSNTNTQPFPPSATANSGLFSRSEANPSAPINFIRKIQDGTTPPASSSTLTPQPPSAHAFSAPPNLNAQYTETDSRESTPASPPYPKPGNGLMAKLGPDVEDIEWLVDANDFDAFSHTVYDEHGNVVPQVEESAGGGVNGGHGHGL